MAGPPTRLLGTDCWGLIRRSPSGTSNSPNQSARFGATDFKTQLSELKAGGAEGLFVAIYGDDAISLYRQARLAGALRHLKVVADSTNELLVPLALASDTPETLWLGTSWYFGGYRSNAMARELHEDYLKRTGNGAPLGLLNSGHSAVLAYAAAIRKAGSVETKPVIAALEGLTFETAKGKVTLRPEDHQAVCDVNFIRIKGPRVEPPLDVNDYVRPDVEVAEFVQHDGASV